jgi:hypothetical protein
MPLSLLPPLPASSYAPTLGRLSHGEASNQAHTPSTVNRQAVGPSISAEALIAAAKPAVPSLTSSPLSSALPKSVSTPQARQVSLLSSASYTVSLNSNTVSHCYSNTSERSAQLTGASSFNAPSRSNTLSLSIDKVAKVETPKALLEGSSTILKFIERRLAGERAAGASSEHLQALLGQGLSGFERGFSEAEVILGNASESISGAIKQLYGEVMDGFEAMTKEYVVNVDSNLAAVANLAVVNNLLVATKTVVADSKIVTF